MIIAKCIKLDNYNELELNKEYDEIEDDYADGNQFNIGDLFITTNSLTPSRRVTGKREFTVDETDISNAVLVNGDQTIAGDKTFTDDVILAKLNSQNFPAYPSNLASGEFAALCYSISNGLSWKKSAVYVHHLTVSLTDSSNSKTATVYAQIFSSNPTAITTAAFLVTVENQTLMCTGVDSDGFAVMCLKYVSMGSYPKWKNTNGDEYAATSATVSDSVQTINIANN